VIGIASAIQVNEENKDFPDTHTKYSNSVTHEEKEKIPKVRFYPFIYYFFILSEQQKETKIQGNKFSPDPYFLSLSLSYPSTNSPNQKGEVSFMKQNKNLRLLLHRKKKKTVL
jgi:hypothetical protein